MYCTEVEAVLYRNESVHQAAVFGVPNTVLGELVCAAVVLRSNEGTTAQDLIDWCGKELAHYKVPSNIYIVDELPTTGSGKIMKMELKDRFKDMPLIGHQATKQHSEIDLLGIAERIQKILHLEDIRRIDKSIDNLDPYACHILVQKSCDLVDQVRINFMSAHCERLKHTRSIFFKGNIQFIAKSASLRAATLICRSGPLPQEEFSS